MNLQPTVSTYTVKERASKIYNTVVDMFDWDRSSDCVTPFELALKQFDGVDPSGTLCIPGAGIGTYVLAALERGIKPESITAIELDEKYYELGSAMFSRFGVNYILADFLTWTPNMKVFNAVVGNPPYQGGNFGKKVYKSLWPLFWAKSFQLVKDSGRVSLITPLTWCSPTNDLSKKDAIDGKTRLWDVFNAYSSVADVTSIKSYFPGVGSTFSLVSVDKNGSAGLTFTDGYVPTLGFYPLAGRERVDAELSLETNIASECRMSGRLGEGVRVSVVKSRMVGEATVEVCESMQTPKSNLPLSLYAHIYCKSVKQAKFVRKRILECADVLNKHCRYNGFIDLKILGLISMEGA
jgi:hypothetical protein